MSTPCFSITPTSRLLPRLLCWLCCIAPCFHHSKQSFLLLQPSPPTNSSYPPKHSVSLPYLSHYIPLPIAVLIVPILHPLFLVLPLSSTEFFSNVWSPIHGLLYFFDLPISFFVACLYVTKILSCSSCGSFISPISSNLFFTSVLYLLLMSLLLSPHPCFLLPMGLCQL